MRYASLRRTICCLALLLCAWVSHAAALPDIERRKIESLISAVEHLDNAVFVRNGKSYSATDAARFLRGKWQAKQADVFSVEDFIVKIGSVSSTSGKPYLIRFPDGREIAAAYFFRNELARQKHKLNVVRRDVPRAGFP